jgi:hypothetical protein
MIHSDRYESALGTGLPHHHPKSTIYQKNWLRTTQTPAIVSGEARLNSSCTLGPILGGGTNTPIPQVMGRARGGCLRLKVKGQGTP